MRKQMACTAVVTLAFGALMVAAATSQDNEKPEHYSAVWAVVGGSVGGASVPIDIHINKYTADADIMGYAELLANKGPEALRSAMEKLDVGQLSPIGRVGTPIAIARKLKVGDKTLIRVLTARNLSFVELHYSGRSVDYPYTFLELTLDKDGKGTGTAIGAAKIRFNKKNNTYEIESLEHGTAYNKLMNVQLMK